MAMGCDHLSIGQLARSAGVGVETIRFYQRRGLLSEPRRVEDRIRRYGIDAVDRVMFVKSAQGLGFSLNDIADLLRLVDGTRCSEARRIAEVRLTSVQTKLRELRRMEAALRSLIGACSDGEGHRVCPLIASLQARPLHSRDDGNRCGAPSCRGR